MLPRLLITPLSRQTLQRWRLCSFLLGPLLVLLFCTTSPVAAATITVTNTNDSGPGSLRQIIADATAGDTITFDASLSGQTIVLSQTLTIDKDLTIDGSALSTPLTLSGNQRVLVLMVKAGVTARLRHLIVADGNRSALPPAPLPRLSAGLYAGAGLQNDGTVTLDRLTLQYNRSTGTKGEGGQGGAIGNNGVLTVTNSFFWHNSSGSGSGILNNGRLFLANSTFAENIAANGWGGGHGGAIDNTGTLTVTNSTFSRNVATGGLGAPGGGAINNTGMAWISHSTFSDNQSTAYRANEGAGSGIANRGVLHLYNTIIANGIDSADCSGLLTTNINNLIEDGSCGAAFSGAPLLGPLVDYGGATFTQALLPGSPAIDAGDNTTCPVTDQRGVARPFDGDSNGSARCDIGAYEAVTPVLATATATPTPTATAAASPTPTLFPTATPFMTVAPRRGDSNGDQIIDRADLLTCMQAIFATDGDVTGSSCDTNQDAVIDAGDISCTGLLRVDGQHLCGADTDQSTGQTVATLTIAGDRTGTGGATVQLPISLSTNGATVTAAAFRLQFDSTYLSFDPSDHNGDALPDALTLIQPPLVSQPLLTVTTHSDALDIALTDLATPPGSWYDGVFVIVNLRVYEISSNAPLTTTVAFAPSVPPSLGSASGTSIPVQAVNGVVRLLPAVPMRQYLPLIRQQ